MLTSRKIQRWVFLLFRSSVLRLEKLEVPLSNKTSKETIKAAIRDCLSKRDFPRLTQQKNDHS